MTTCASPSGASPPKRLAARSKIFIAASALSGVFSDGFQITGLPQTSASAAFHDQTATGKLNAEMTAHGPIGCHVSIMRWPGRSEAMVRPCSWRDRPTAKSQMSIISCTSPSPSETILPASSVTTAPSVSLAARNSSPTRRTSSPRRGAGTSRQRVKALPARAMTAATSERGVSLRRAISAPSIGERTASAPSASSAGLKPARCRTSWVVMGWPSSLSHWRPPCADATTNAICVGGQDKCEGPRSGEKAAGRARCKSGRTPPLLRRARPRPGSLSPSAAKPPGDVGAAAAI